MTEPLSSSAPAPLRELGLRIASAIALGAATLLLTWGGVYPFAVLAAIVGAIVAWEWGRVVRGANVDAAFLAACLVVCAAAVLASNHLLLPALAVIAAGAAAAMALSMRNEPVAAALGVIYASSPVVALTWLRSDPKHGLVVILTVLLAVWATDIGAFIAGRSIGGPKLWPKVSPNKTWAGLIGGVLSAGCVTWLLAAYAGSGSPPLVALLGTMLGLVSQGGDLFESAIKRSHGVKDSSHLIPGHGGFMDRVDGLIPAAVLAALLAALVAPASPGEALLGLP